MSHNITLIIKHCHPIIMLQLVNYFHLLNYSNNYSKTLNCPYNNNYSKTLNYPCLKN